MNEALLQLLADRTRGIYAMIDDAFLLGMPHRLARRLADLFEQQKRKNGEAWVQASHEELANMIGSSRQSVSGTLKDWERKGIIALAYGRVELHSEALLAELIDN